MQQQLPLRPCRIEYGKYLSKDYVPEECLLAIRFELCPGKPEYRFCTLYLNQLKGLELFKYVRKADSTDHIFLLDRHQATDIESLFIRQYMEFKNLYNQSDAYYFDHEMKHKYCLFLK